ncbi:MAG TPA: hypothetical protein VK094_07820 [Pseudogracilibacillus sp.]|nr:hypothetical protein [Pseudogracilibacillus sp.]
MNRNILITIISAIVSVLASLVFYDLYTGSKKDRHRESRIMKLAGKPGQEEEDEVEKMENAKMVSEGSQFGVHYYDRNKNV